MLRVQLCNSKILQIKIVCITIPTFELEKTQILGISRDVGWVDVYNF